MGLDGSSFKQPKPGQLSITSLPSIQYGDGYSIEKGSLVCTPCLSSHLYQKRPYRASVKNEDLLKRITINPKVMVGKPVIQGTRLTVEYILGLLAHGTTIEEILEEYTGLEKDDIYAGLLFASKTLEDASYVP
jgi:uncharacterized protein (DUF433 family)